MKVLSSALMKVLRTAERMVLSSARLRALMKVLKMAVRTAQSLVRRKALMKVVKMAQMTAELIYTELNSAQKLDWESMMASMMVQRLDR